MSIKSDLKIAAIAAVAGLVGSFAGAGAAIYTDKSAAHRQEASRLRDLTASAYERALTFEGDVVDERYQTIEVSVGGPTPTIRKAQTLEDRQKATNDISRAQSIIVGVTIYGSRDSRTLIQEFFRGLVTVRDGHRESGEGLEFGAKNKLEALVRREIGPG